MAAHSSVLARRIPWTEEPEGLQFMGSQRVRHDSATNTCAHMYHKIHPYEDFPGSPVVKTLHAHCRGHRFNPWWGNQDLTCRITRPKKKKKDDEAFLISLPLRRVLLNDF